MRRLVLIIATVLLVLPSLALGILLTAVSPPVDDFQPRTWSPEPGLQIANELRSPAQVVPITTESPYGPEDIAVDDAGVVYTGDRNGIIRRVRPDGSTERFAVVGGRPLGLAFDARQNLIVANHGEGLQSVAPDGTVTLLADRAAGEPIRFANDLVIGSDGVVWFTDSSSRYNTTVLGDVPSYLMPDLVDGRASGRLLRYDLANGEITQVLDGLYFPNGVALTDDEDAVWIAESTRYRILRHTLADGLTTVIVEDLPGVPDGLNSGTDGSMLVALYDRSGALDSLVLPTALGRQLMIRLPNSLFVNEDDPLTGSILVLDSTGRPQHLHTGLDPAATNVVPHNERWYLGALLGQPVRSMTVKRG
ncbi:SMP-30/gluconolactonase/LRE family protein [Kribbella turkmenica]|uniref:SMP-30/gluconolactonase/LRE family protein n=1 Tax=Kribbella turkmenica TaxID=2530375 RepID=UPI0014047D24|nr:SMP-30/gluconolactonase/LRE family protein [Kribbella turkmenica]